MITLTDETEIEIPVLMKHVCKVHKKSKYKREWYKNMTHEQREARHERQKLHNREPKHKEAYIEVV
jgi:hypothetical protein